MCLAMLPASALEESLTRCTELGAESFLLVSAARSVGRAAGAGSGAASSDRRRARWDAVCREAAMLAGRFQVPAVDGPVGFGEALERFGEQRAFVLDRRAEVSLARVFRASAGPASLGPVALFIGPEGGWSEEEVRLAGGRLRGLGARNLRAPNAAAAALAVTLAAGGDL